jgi:hypothetical protein
MSILESELETQLKKFYNLRAWLQYDFTDYHDYESLSATTKMSRSILLKKVTDYIQTGYRVKQTLSLSIFY